MPDVCCFVICVETCSLMNSFNVRRFLWVTLFLRLYLHQNGMQCLKVTVCLSVCLFISLTECISGIGKKICVCEMSQKIYLNYVCILISWDCFENIYFNCILLLQFWAHPWYLLKMGDFELCHYCVQLHACLRGLAITIMYVCMYVRMYVCVYVFMYVCMYVCACVYVCMYVYVCAYVYMYVCVRVCVCVCMYVCICACVYVCMCVCMYVCMCACMCVCMYVCMDVCTYVCMCVYVFMYVCLYVLYVCIYVRMYVYVCMYVYIKYIHITQLCFFASLKDACVKRHDASDYVRPVCSRHQQWLTHRDSPKAHKVLPVCLTHRKSGIWWSVNIC